ncbi:ABC transporter permease [Nocardia neocaledoniensis]|uniref:ABC transporter permease n=1 Tax=Nocardia neocaledoniensis TaxID=236511 RepID=UPI002455695D|nr:ABC transporter permease [Nocardia neocaledoniensis]
MIAVKAFALLVLRRVALLLALLALVFVAVDLLPGSAASSTLGRDANRAELAAKEHELGLDRALPVQFWHWLSGVLTGDFGQTSRGNSVGALLADKFPQTLLLGGVALLLTVLVSLALGCWWAVRPNAFGARLLQPASTIAVAVPEFVCGTLLILVFSLATGLLPAVTITDRSGYPAGADMLILPVLALAIPQIGWNARVVRSALQDVATAPHVESAVLDGLPTRTVLLRHMLPFAAPTIVVGYATTVGMMFGGALVVETLFNYPGVGAVLAGSVADRDTATVAAVVALTAIVTMVLLAVADVVRRWAAEGAR